MKIYARPKKIKSNDSLSPKKDKELEELKIDETIYLEDLVIEEIKEEKLILDDKMGVKRKKKKNKKGE